MTLEQLIEECPHFWSLGISGDVNKPKYCAYSLVSTRKHGTISGYGDTPRKAVESLYDALEQRRVEVDIKVVNMYPLK